MGCINSRSKNTSESTITTSSSNNSNNNSRKEWKGVLKGVKLLVKDKFTSSLTGETLYKWRESEVIENKDRKVLIHYIGWNKKFDDWIDLETDRKYCIAPKELLSKHQRNKGISLTDEQKAIVYQYIVSGKLPNNIKLYNDNDNDDDNNNDSEMHELKKSYQPSTFPFAVGQKVDVREKISNGNIGRWRVARITAIDDEMVTIHYIGLDNKHDEIINMIQDGFRIMEYGSMTSLQNRDSVSMGRSNTVPLKAKEGTRRKSFDVDNQLDVLAPLKTVEKKSFVTKNKSTSAISPSSLITDLDDDINARSVDDIGESPPSSPTHSMRKQSVGSMGSMRKNSISPSGRPTFTRRQSFPPPTRTRSIEEKFMDRMEKCGLHILHVQGDGNCLFRAVSHQLYLNESHHNDLRRACVKHMEIHRERFQLFCTTNFDDHLRYMALNGSWGDDLEIKALEEILDRLIVIYSTDSTEQPFLQPLQTNFEEQFLLKDVSPIILSYHGQSHYNR